MKRTAARWMRELNNRDRLRRLRWRQAELIAAATPWLVMGALSDLTWTLAIAVALITCARDEALRFRAVGYTYQSRMALWLGATPHDRAHRHLLDGWRP